MVVTEQTGAIVTILLPQRQPLTKNETGAEERGKAAEFTDAAMPCIYTCHYKDKRNYIFCLSQSKLCFCHLQPRALTNATVK
jgi:hypothetical protein